MVCFADFSKSLIVTYWKLFRQLIDMGLSTWIASLLAFWYSYRQVCMQPRSTSSSFFVGNGTKQGGVYCTVVTESIYLLCTYVDSIQPWVQHWWSAYTYTCIGLPHGFIGVESTSAFDYDRSSAIPQR